MTILLDGTNGITTPALTSTGGVNLATTSGNVGIGTASPSAKLDVVNNANSTTSVTVTNTNGGGSANANSRYTNSASTHEFGALSTAFSTYGVLTPGSAYAYAGNNQAMQFAVDNNYIAFGTGTGAIERMRINSSGNVGIGTNAPSQKLEVYGQRIRINATPDPGIEFANTSAVKGYVFFDTANDLMTIRHASSNGIQLTSGGSAYLYTGNYYGVGAWQCYFTANINVNTNQVPGVIGSYASGATNAPDSSGILWNGMGGNNGTNGYVSPNDGGQFWQNYSNSAVYNRKRWGGGYGAWVYVGG